MDIWELRPERAAEAEELMRQAAAEFLTLMNYGYNLDVYLVRWYVTLGLG